MLDRGRLKNFPMCIGQERNFHIFYQLLAGYPILNSLRAEDFAKFLFGDEIGIDLQKDDQVVDGVDDRKGFERLKESFDVFGFSDDEQQEIFDIVAGILVFSKTTFLAHFDEDTKTEISVVHDSMRSYFCMAAKLWGITEDALEETLCSRLAHDKTFMPRVWLWRWIFSA